MSSKIQYRLRTELQGHSSDVRCVAVSTSGIVATGSRDRFIHIWESTSSTPVATLQGHEHWVNALTYIKSGHLASGSADGSIRIWDVPSKQCLSTLKGHKQAVCALSQFPDSDRIVSASWDKTAQIWDLQQEVSIRTCTGHEAAVWGVLALPGGRMVSVGADKTVRLWNESGVSSALSQVHTDVVRTAVKAPNNGFVTVSNDSAIVYWKPTAGGSFSPAGSIPNLHDGNYIYSVDSLERESGSWLFATGGEDNAVRIIEARMETDPKFACIQTIMHPGTVWDVAFCPNGDIVTACSDGVARIFSTDESVMADAEMVAAFEKAVSERKVSTKIIGGVDVSKLQNADEALRNPGAKDGENKIVRNANGTPEVYMWSAAENKWTKIGDVVDDPNKGNTGGTVKGKKYDFVFDVELGESGPKEKLGYNRGENPFSAAQRFIDDNDGVNQDFLEQIARFIIQQVPPEAMGAGSIGSGSSDPLTGGSRYVPGGSSSARAATNGDPFTGGSRYVPGGSSRPSKPVRKVLPWSAGPITFATSGSLDAIAKKISESNDAFLAKELLCALSPAEMRIFEEALLQKLRSAREGAIAVLEDSECFVIEQLVKWPTSDVFPALDVARLAVALPSGGAYFFGKQNGSVLIDILKHVASSDASAAVLIMGCRFICNMFMNRIVAGKLREQCSNVLEACTGATKSPNKRARETFASLLLNYAVLFNDSQAPVNERQEILTCAISISSGESDEEVLYKLICAVGTLICNDSGAKKMAMELGVAKMAADAAPKSTRLQQIAEEIATLIVD